MTPNANLFEPERKKKAHSKTHHKDAEAILRVFKDLWKMKQRGDLRGASKLLTKHNVSRLPVDIYLGFIEGKSYDELTLDYASEVKPLLNKAKKERYGKQEPQAQTIEDAKAPLTIEDAPSSIDWEQRRYEIAKDVLPSVIAAVDKEHATLNIFDADANHDEPDYEYFKNTVEYAVAFADEMIKELKQISTLKQ